VIEEEFGKQTEALAWNLLTLAMQFKNTEIVLAINLAACRTKLTGLAQVLVKLFLGGKIKEAVVAYEKVRSVVERTGIWRIIPGSDRERTDCNLFDIANFGNFTMEGLELLDLRRQLFLIV
jgi:hypothetical protein